MVQRFRSVCAVACLAVVVAVTAAEARQAPVLSAPTASGNTVTFNWTATAGATGYRLDYGVASGVYIGSLPVGVVTTYTVPGAPNGVFYIRVVAQTAGGDVASNQVTLQLPAPPSVPTGLTIARNGTGIVAVWTAGAGGGAPTGYRLYASQSPGGAALAVLASNIPSWGIGGGVPTGTYYFRATAVNAAGESGPSNEVTVVMPAGGACDAPPAPALTTSSWGTVLTASWTPITGAANYLFDYNGPGFVGQLAIPATQTRLSYRTLPLGTWQFGVRATFACGQAGGVGNSTLVIDNSTLKLEPRAADPAPGTALPTPSYFRQTIIDMANNYPAELRASCVETGGNNRWLFRVVAQLRTRDKRWGLNWKRANIGDMSQDIVTYNWSSDPDEGTFNTRVYDIISGHCGSNPGWNDTEVTVLGSRGSIWTLEPYIAAGYTP